MKNILFRTVFALLLIWVQSTTITAQTDTIHTGGNVNFYLDCGACDFTFVRQKLPFVSFVRDNNLADVHVLVSISHTGSGAHKYFFNFIGKNAFKGMDHDYELVTDPSYTEDETRNGLLKILQIGIIPYYCKSGYIENVDINLEGNEHSRSEELVIDRWNKWIIELSSGGNFEKEESQNEASWETEVSIGKLTPDWKVRMEARYEIDRENYFDDGNKIVNNQDEKLLNAYYIKSLTPKWSAGLYGEYASSTFMNSRHSFEFDAGIEYNFFPWDESNRRIFSLAYIAGVSADEYHEETIFGKIKETQPFESLLLKLELVETWGTLEMDMEGRHLFSDFSKSRLTLGADVSVRLSKHISVFGEMETQVVHDQLYLPKGDASVEDILLRRRKLASTYQTWFNAGIRLTIGSIFSNVVNERFNLE